MECEVESGVAAAERVSRAIQELKALQDPLLSGEVDLQTLSDFRDALNRVRNIAWAAQQSAAGPLLEQDAGKVSALLASERIRAAYQLCLSIRDDIRREDIAFQNGQLLELYEVAKTMVAELRVRVRKIR